MMQERQQHRVNIAQRLDRHAGHATAVYNTGILLKLFLLKITKDYQQKCLLLQLRLISQRQQINNNNYL